ncbi:MAG TPA: hypothetical protein VK638_29400 [Edaphobacter sp.]|nr:hypothetical protein [Edaphobacter sp.]
MISDSLRLQAGSGTSRGSIKFLQLVQQIQQLTHILIVLHHGIGVLITRHAALPAFRIGDVREAHPDEKGVHADACFLMYVSAAFSNSSSEVSIRVAVSGPVSSILPLRRYGSHREVHTPSETRSLIW